jgi:hypothetical protein
MAPALKVRAAEPVEFLRSERRLFVAPPPLAKGELGVLGACERRRDTKRAALVRTRRLNGSGASFRDLDIFSCSVSWSADLLVS